MRVRPTYIGITKAAQLIDVSPRTITRYIKDGHLEAGELPYGQVRLSRSQVIGLIRPAPGRNLS